MEYKYSIMSHVNFFKPQIESLPFLSLGQIAVEGRALTIDILGDDKKVYKFGFDDLFQIRGKIQANLAEIQSSGATEDVKQQLEVLKGKLVGKLNSDRGWFKSMSKEETQLVDAYFGYMHTLLDTPLPGKARRFLSGTFKVGVVGALAYGAYGAYRYFGQ